jgi:hypothetical protein
VTKLSFEHEFFLKMLNLPCQTLMAWNGLALAHYVGSGAKLALTGLLGALPT